MVYLADILMMGHTFQEHFNNLREVLERPHYGELQFQAKKCHLAQQ